jgi:hypothetical protein
MTPLTRTAERTWTFPAHLKPLQIAQTRPLRVGDVSRTCPRICVFGPLPDQGSRARP